MPKPYAHGPSIASINRDIGPYRIRGLLGSGGAGYVVLGEHKQLGKRVAIKCLRDNVAERPDAVETFLAEAKAVCAIRHPHIVEITNFDESNGRPYAVMELLEGQTLSQLIADEGPLPPKRALHIAHQVADALNASHTAGIIHRDIKPSNIYLAEGQAFADYVKILDFGTAQLALRKTAESAPKSDKPKAPWAGSSSDKVIGTPVYIAPEIVLGKDVDPRVDVYALGVVLFEMLTGHPPFTADSSVEYYYKHMSEAPPRLRDQKAPSTRASKELDSLVNDCLAKDPEARPASAGILRQQLAAIALLDYRAVLAANLAPAAAGRTLGSGSGKWLAIVGLACLLLIGAGVGYKLTKGTNRGGEAPKQPPSAAPMRPAMTPALALPRREARRARATAPSPDAGVSRRRTTPSSVRRRTVTRPRRRRVVTSRRASMRDRPRTRRRSRYSNDGTIDPFARPR